MAIPSYPVFKPLERDDKQLFESYYSKRGIAISDHTFTNYYIWRKLDRTQLTVIGGYLCPMVIGPDKKSHFMMPLGDGEIRGVVKACLEHTGSIIRVDEAFKTALGESEEYKIAEDREQFDYIYPAKDLAELKGRRYDAKRNHINAFLKKSDFTYEAMGARHIEECLQLNEIWCKKKKSENEEFPNLECEAEAVKEALLNKDFLGLSGGVLISGGKIIAFSLGQKLTEDTAVIHIEKSDPSLRGAAQLMNREFVRNEWAGFAYINREQDMGHPGLRKAKESYHPAGMGKKYNISQTKARQE